MSEDAFIAIDAISRDLLNADRALYSALGGVQRAKRRVAPKLPFWVGREGLQLDEVLVVTGRNTVLVRFSAGPSYELPWKTLGSQRVLAAELDEFRHGVVVVFEDLTTTTVASDFVLHELEPEYRVRLQTRHPARPAKLIGLRIRALREKKGLSSAAVARALRIAPPNYSRLEAGAHRPRTETLLALARLFAVPVGHLLEKQTGRRP